MKHFSSFLMLTSVFLSGYNAFEIEDHLQKIHDLTTNSAILNCQQQDYTVIPVPLTTSKYKSWQEKAKMAANLIEETQSIRHRKLIESSIRHLLGKNSIIQEVEF